MTRPSIPMGTEVRPHRCVFAICVLNFVPSGFHEFLFCFPKCVYCLIKGLKTWFVLSDETRGRLRMDELAHGLQVFRSDTGSKSLDYIQWT